MAANVAIPILLGLMGAANGSRNKRRGAPAAGAREERPAAPTKKMWIGHRLVEVSEPRSRRARGRAPSRAPRHATIAEGGTQPGPTLNTRAHMASFADRILILGQGESTHLGPNWWAAEGQELFETALEQYAANDIELSVENVAFGVLGAALPAWDWEAYVRNENATPAVDNLVMRVRQRVARELAQLQGTTSADGTIQAPTRDSVLGGVDLPEVDPLADESGFVPGATITVGAESAEPASGAFGADGDDESTIAGPPRETPQTASDGDGEAIDDVEAPPSDEPEPEASAAPEPTPEPEPEAPKKKTRRGGKKKKS